MRPDFRRCRICALRPREYINGGPKSDPGLRFQWSVDGKPRWPNEALVLFVDHSCQAFLLSLPKAKMIAIPATTGTRMVANSGITVVPTLTVRVWEETWPDGSLTCSITI